MFESFAVKRARRAKFRSIPSPVQLQFGFFNIFNHPTFAAPVTTIDTSSGGQISSTLNAGRTIEMALKFVF